jgi:hypothetical protein
VVLLCASVVGGAHIPRALPRGQVRRVPHRMLMSEAPSQGSIKAALFRTALISGRGVWARPNEKAAITKLVADLERSVPEETALRDGTWELIASDVEPFRASTFFLALAEAVEVNIQSGASDGALTVHSLATGGGEVGRVAHVIEGNGSRLHSLVELTSASLPSLPLALTGTVVSSGELSPLPLLDGASGCHRNFQLDLKNTTVQQSRVRYGLPSEGGLQPGVEANLLSWVGDQLVSSGDVFGRVLDPLGGGHASHLLLSYADEDVMIWRTPRLGEPPHFFVFARGEEEAWPAMDELRTRQSTASQSLVGSAMALGMLNPFFTRAAGIRK